MPRPGRSDEKRRGEISRDNHMGEAIGKGRVEDDLQPIDRHHAPIDDLEPLRGLHPAVRRENPGGGNERAKRYHHGRRREAGSDGSS